MIFHFQTLNTKYYKLKAKKLNSGMTYVEVLTVLAIFSIMTSIVLFNYRDFQAKVDIKNLASDIALKVVEAQKASLDGKLPPPAQNLLISDPLTWKPSYGVYFDTTPPLLQKQLIYFTDLDNTSPPQNSSFDSPGSSCAGTDECLDKITITKNNYIHSIDNCNDITCSSPTSICSLSIVFKRPDYMAIFTGKICNSPTDGIITTTSHIQINIASPNLIATAKIKIYPSGRIQVN